MMTFKPSICSEIHRNISIYYKVEDTFLELKLQRFQLPDIFSENSQIDFGKYGLTYQAKFSARKEEITHALGYLTCLHTALNYCWQLWLLTNFANGTPHFRGIDPFRGNSTGLHKTYEVYIICHFGVNSARSLNEQKMSIFSKKN